MNALCLYFSRILKKDVHIHFVDMGKYWGSHLGVWFYGLFASLCLVVLLAAVSDVKFLLVVILLYQTFLKGLLEFLVWILCLAFPVPLAAELEVLRHKDPEDLVNVLDRDGVHGPRVVGFLVPHAREGHGDQVQDGHS